MTQAVLSIHDMLGHPVALLEEGTKPAGSHYFRWTGTDRDGKLLGSGVYFYRLQAGPHEAMKKMIVIR